MQELGGLGGNDMTPCEARKARGLEGRGGEDTLRWKLLLKNDYLWEEKCKA